MKSKVGPVNTLYNCYLTLNVHTPSFQLNATRNTNVRTLIERQVTCHFAYSILASPLSLFSSEYCHLRLFCLFCLLPIVSFPPFLW